MAYADQQMSSNRVIAIVIVALIHIALGYLLVTGLAVSAFEEVVERVTTVDVEEPPPPEPEDEPPPPPPEQEVPEVSPPPVVPPTPIQPRPNPVFSQTTQDLTPRPQTPRVATKTCPGGQTVLSSQNCPPATKTCPNGATVAVSASCPVPEPSKARGVSPDGLGRWAARIQGDYPSSALRREEQGTVTMRITVGTNGRVEACAVTGSSGSSALDDAACRGMQRYARYNPALNDAGNPISSTTTQAIRYVLPE